MQSKQVFIIYFGIKFVLSQLRICKKIFFQIIQIILLHLLYKLMEF